LSRIQRLLIPPNSSLEIKQAHLMPSAKNKFEYDQAQTQQQSVVALRYFLTEIDALCFGLFASYTRSLTVA